MAGAFEGVRIVDLSEGIAGPMACMLLADQGADVVKVESPRGDRLADHPGYLCWNRNKRRVVLERDDPTLQRLVQGAAAVVCDGIPGERAAEFEDPGLVELWLPAYGSHPSWAGLEPDDALLWAYGSSAKKQFSWEDVPVWLATPQASYGHAMLAANALGAALYERARSGRGQRVTVSGLHAIGYLHGGHPVLTDKVEKLPDRGARGRVANYRMYVCADGEWFFMATLMEAHFRQAIEAIGLPELWEIEGVENEFPNVMKPGVARHVNAALESHFASRTRAEWLRVLRAHGVPCAPVGDRETWFAGETVAANAMRIERTHEQCGRVTLPGVPVRLSETPGEVRHLMRESDPAQLVSEARAPTARVREPANGGALADVVVLDLGVIIAGTYSNALLADFGADVIKVEPLTGDPFRPYGLGFLGFNQGKRSLSLDLKHPEGREAFYDLVRRADVVCDNYRLGVLERLGIDYAALSRINPRIVQASVTAYGSSGPLSSDPGFDPLLQAEGGLMAAQGGSDEPVFHQVAVHDTASAMVVAFGILAALHARERTGRGQRVETSLADQSVLIQSGELTHYADRPPNRPGDRDCLGVSALSRFYRCSDGWIAIAAREAAPLAAALGIPDAAGLDPARDGALADAISAVLQGLDRATARERLTTGGIAALPALEEAELFHDPAHQPDRFFHAIDHPKFGSVTAVRSFAEWSRSTSGFSRRPPLLGEHSEDVLREFGFSPDRIARLKDAGALYAP